MGLKIQGILWYVLGVAALIGVGIAYGYGNVPLMIYLGLVGLGSIEGSYYIASKVDKQKEIA